DIEDFANNTDRKVAESGFDIHSDDSLSPFFSFVNGPVEMTATNFQYTLTNHEGLRQKGSFSIPPVGKYQTVFLHFNEHIDGLASFLDEDGDKKATINGRKLDLTSLGSTTAFAAEVQFLQTQSSFASDLFNFSKSLEQKLFSNLGS
ncbi:MAG: hypothetical protein HRT90_01225, partial [Candidatus Margulisbacteria bacterium]|nr:hypothetical protein [Candidatus Margulisiibacteriota bacterium]